MTKVQYISQLILARQNTTGCSIREAIDYVCGEGTSERLISDLYDDFNAEQEA